MSIRFRKTFTNGPFRSTWTGNGMGFSWGIGGFRVGYGAGGGMFYSVCIPGTGFYWRKYIGRTGWERSKS